MFSALCTLLSYRWIPVDPLLKNARRRIGGTNLAQSSVHGLQVRPDEDGTEAVSHQGLSHEHRQLVLLLCQQLQAQVCGPPQPAGGEGRGWGRKIFSCI